MTLCHAYTIFPVKIRLPYTCKSTCDTVLYRWAILKQITLNEIQFFIHSSFSYLSQPDGWKTLCTETDRHTIHPMLGSLALYIINNAHSLSCDQLNNSCKSCSHNHFIGHFKNDKNNNRTGKHVHKHLLIFGERCSMQPRQNHKHNGH